ncbi:hypothetical protein Hthe01_20920 [Hydrogenophilus thermoluteolus]|nr:hypothetical protein Hthe01_20920 [Hydrogenophilus thermoluteolus]
MAFQNQACRAARNITRVLPAERFTNSINQPLRCPFMRIPLYPIRVGIRKGFTKLNAKGRIEIKHGSTPRQ